MVYSEVKLKKLMKAENLSIEDEITANIPNYILTIHLNKQDFIKSKLLLISYNREERAPPAAAL